MFPERLELTADGRRAVYVLRRDLTPEDGSAAWYELEGSGTLAEATGSVWVRFLDGVDAASRAADVERAGYHIERIPGYATNAAFVRAETAADALAKLDALRALGDVEVVEPQLRKKLGFR